MDRKTIDAILETVLEMVHRQYAEALEHLLDHLLYELISTEAVDPASLDARLTSVARGLDLATPGAVLLLRAREICRMAVKGTLPAGLLLAARRNGESAPVQRKDKTHAASARRSPPRSPRRNGESAPVQRKDKTHAASARRSPPRSPRRKKKP